MRTLPAKRVLVRTDARGGLAPLATFYLDGERLMAEWANTQYQSEVERDGIRALVDGQPARVKPSAGRAFYEALEEAYWRSSLMVVEAAEVERE